MQSDVCTCSSLQADTDFLCRPQATGVGAQQLASCSFPLPVCGFKPSLNRSHTHSNPISFHSTPPSKFQAKKTQFLPHVSAHCMDSGIRF